MSANVGFCMVSGDRYDPLLAGALRVGLKKHGIPMDAVPVALADTDRFRWHAFGGLKTRYQRALNAAGNRVICMDKGYSRLDNGRRFWKVSIGGLHPTVDQLYETHRTKQRWVSFGQPVVRMRWNPSGTIIVAGHSRTYSDWHQLGCPLDYARRVVESVRKYTDRPITYRPKPAHVLSTGDRSPIDGTAFSGPEISFERAMLDCSVLITHGSGAAAEALRCGVPVVTLGAGVATHLACQLSEIDAPPLMESQEVANFLYHLAWWQWRLDEIRSGDGLRHVMEYITDESRVDRLRPARVVDGGSPSMEHSSARQPTGEGHTADARTLQ